MDPRPLLLSVLALALAACPAAEPITLATYNAGLAVGFVPGAEERAQGTSDAVATLDADVICVQEYWEADHVTLLEGATASEWPHTLFAEPDQQVGPDPACEASDIDPLITCMNDSCGDACIDELPDCLLSSCPFQFVGLEKDCMRCVQANVGDDPDTIRDTCMTELTEYAYGGSFGTGIVSRHPFAATDELVYDSTTNRRSLLHATVDAPGQQIDVYCTHLTPVFSVIPFPREEGSWEEEQASQIQVLRARIDETATSGRVALLGDFNTGPSGGGNSAEIPDAYDALAEGYSNPYHRQDTRCTFCPENPLTSVDSDETGRIIDHVLLAGFEGEIAATRVLDQAVEIESCGDPIPGAHSDHYGVQVTITP